jgi:hypothetical protein
MLKKILVALFLVMCVGGFSMSSVSALPIQKDTYMFLKVDETKKDKWSPFIITVEAQGDASDYVKAKVIASGNGVEYTGLKPTPAGKTADFKVSKIAKKFDYYIVHVTVIGYHIFTN